MEHDEQTKKPKRAEQVQDAPLLEKIISLCGLILTLFVLSVLAFEAKRHEDKPPEIKLRKVSVEPLSEGYLVRFEAENKGSSTTAGLVIEGEIGEGEDKETSNVTLDYVPAHSKREGGLFFSMNPDAVKLRALGFQKP